MNNTQILGFTVDFSGDCPKALSKFNRQRLIPLNNSIEYFTRQKVLQGETSGDERRKFERTPTSIRVEIKHPSIGTIIGFAKDISDGGAQVTIENHSTPPVGTLVDVQFKKLAGPINEEPVPMRVMHARRNVIGLMFVGS